MPKTSVRLTIACRQLAERGRELDAWITRARPALGVAHIGLQLGVRRALQLSDSVQSATDIPPSIAIVGNWGAPRMDVALEMLEPSAGMAISTDDIGAFPTDLLSTLVPRDDRGGASCLIRLRGARTPTVDIRHPIAARILTEPDVLMVLAATWLGEVAVGERLLTDARDLERFFVNLPVDMTDRSSPSLSTANLWQVRSFLCNRFSHSRDLAALDAFDYWRQLGDALPQMTEQQRARALSFLWGQDSHLSSVFAKCSEALSAVGHSNKVYLPLDAVETRSEASGWRTSHPASVLNALSQLSTDDGRDDIIRVVRIHGGNVALSRQSCALILAEATLVPRANWRVGTGNVDVVIFPAPAPYCAATNMSDATVVLGGIVDEEDALQRFLRAKAIYLMDAAVDNGDVTSLVACMQSDAQLSTATSAAVADWIDFNVGATAHDRERVRNSFFVVTVPPTDAQATESTELDLPGTDGLSTQNYKALDMLFSFDRTLRTNWTPQRRFSAAAEYQPMKDANQSSALGALLEQICEATTAAAKQQQLVGRLARGRQALVAQFMHFHTSSDPVQIIDWRRRNASIVYNRGDVARELGGVLRLQQAIFANEDDQLRLLSSRDATSLHFITHEDYTSFARLVVERWLTKINTYATSKRFSKQVGIANSLLQSMVEEITIAAVRTDLTGTMAVALEKCQPAIATRNQRAATLATAQINAFVAMLAQSASRSSRAMSREDDGGTGLQPWLNDYVRLVDDNLEKFTMLPATTTHDRELGEILSKISVQL